MEFLRGQTEVAASRVIIQAGTTSTNNTSTRQQFLPRWLSQQHFTQQINIVIPNSISHSSLVNTLQSVVASAARKHSAYFFQGDCRCFLQSPFSTNFVLPGHVHATTVFSSVLSTNSFSIVGKNVYLLLDKDTYQTLGIGGSFSLQQDCYRVIVPITKGNMARLADALSFDRIGPISLMFYISPSQSTTSHDGQAASFSFTKDFIHNTSHDAANAKVNAPKPHVRQIGMKTATALSSFFASSNWTTYQPQSPESLHVHHVFDKKLQWDCASTITKVGTAVSSAKRPTAKHSILVPKVDDDTDSDDEDSAIKIDNASIANKNQIVTQESPYCDMVGLSNKFSARISRSFFAPPQPGQQPHEQFITALLLLSQNIVTQGDSCYKFLKTHPNESCGQPHPVPDKPSSRQNFSTAYDCLHLLDIQLDPTPPSNSVMQSSSCGGFSVVSLRGFFSSHFIHELYDMLYSTLLVTSSSLPTVPSVPPLSFGFHIFGVNDAVVVHGDKFHAHSMGLGGSGEADMHIWSTVSNTNGQFVMAWCVDPLSQIA